MPINAGRALANLDELRLLTADADGAQRLAWSGVWLKARAWFEAKLKALPFAVEQHHDAAGNGWVTVSGRSPKVMVFGSHLDSVPNGGWLDGCLGVLAGLEVLTALAEDSGGVPEVTLRLVDWADEEGARFGRSLFGSSAFAGTHTIEADRVRVDRWGATMRATLEGCGVNVHSIGDAEVEKVGAGVYLELHIEQGPVLEAMGLPLGVVLGTKGVERWAVTFTGQEAHSGSTPMAVRRDALAAAALMALEIRVIAKKHPDAVATMGSVKTFPGIVTAVVGRCETTLDLRDLDGNVLAQMLADCRAASERFAEQEGCTVEWAKIWSIEPIAFHEELIALCNEAVTEVSGRSHLMPSGPLHDAAEVSRAGIPTVMMFVQSLQGLSHNKAEDTRREDLVLAVEAFDKLARKTAKWLVESA